MSAFRWVLTGHIAAGFCALVLLWIPLLARKGGALHRKVGWAYVTAMGLVSASALALCAFRLTNGDSQDDVAGLFLGHVSVLTGKNVYAGMRALWHRKPSRPLMLGLDWAVSLLLVVSSLGMTAVGIAKASALPLVFALLGFTSAAPELWYLSKRRQVKNEWFFRHLGNMVASGIAAITAFLVVNAPRFGLGIFNSAVWIAPGAIGAVGISLWTAYYRRKFAGASVKTTLLPMPDGGLEAGPLERVTVRRAEPYRS